MTNNCPKPKLRRSANNNDTPGPETPYALLPFPQRRPQLKHPIGHDRYRQDRLHGKLVLKLTVKIAVHGSTGIMEWDHAQSQYVHLPMLEASTDSR